MKDVAREPGILERMEDLLATMRKHREQIEVALAYGHDAHTFDSVVASIIAGARDLYTLPNAVIIAEVGRYANFSVYHGFIAAGDLNEILAFDDQFIKEGRLRGCKFVSITGRRGWEPTLRKQGWSHDLSILYKEVPNE